MIKYNHLLFIFALFYGFNGYAFAGVSEYTINCGHGKLEDEALTISKVTTDIPFVTKQVNPLFAFGCVINSQQNSFILQASIKVPNVKLKTLDTNFYATAKAENDSLTINSAPVEFDNKGYLVLRLDESDSVGSYTANIYINGDFARSVVFNVYY